ncbi:MAG TPA: creatininase family protein [Candidatus Nanopelagicaceae bacterium]|nr:creatininase family protein [Candidatus Nanopelagicaceae bacterium]
MNPQSIMDLASPDVRDLIARSGVAVIPIGSTEQHGPHLPSGTDTMIAELIGESIATKLDALYVPFGPYGVTPIHAGHPGTISLRRSTFEALLTDILEELTALGVKTFVLVNWHEGNIPSMDAVAYSTQGRLGINIVAAQACYVAQRIYKEFGGELTHGGGIETLGVMAYDPELVLADRVTVPTRPKGAEELDEMRRSKEVYGFVTDVTELANDGWYGNPHWAKSTDAPTFADVVADEVIVRVQAAREARKVAQSR